MTEYQAYKQRKPNNFLSMFFAVFLAGFMLLIVVKLYVEYKVRLIGSKFNDAANVYWEHKFKSLKKE
jgi:hypothetical protein